MFDFLVIGDVKVDRIIRVNDSDIVRTIDEHSHTVTIPYPAKVRLQEAPYQFAGGNAFNVSKTMAKLSTTVALYSVMGTDRDSHSLEAELMLSGVNCDLVQKDPHAPANSSMVISIAGDRTIFSYQYPHKYTLPQLPPVSRVYLTSVGEDDLPLFHQILEQKAQQKFELWFSPGSLQTSESFSDIKEIMTNTDMLILNKAEAKAISRLNTESDENLMYGLRHLGAKTIIITRSKHGAVALQGDQVIKVGALQIEAIESTGAGDVFSGTICYAMSKGLDLKTAMEMGAINSAHAVMQVGATNGILTEAELHAEHSRYKDQLVFVEPKNSYSN